MRPEVDAAPRLPAREEQRRVAHLDPVQLQLRQHQLHQRHHGQRTLAFRTLEVEAVQAVE